MYLLCSALLILDARYRLHSSALDEYIALI